MNTTTTTPLITELNIDQQVVALCKNRGNLFRLKGSVEGIVDPLTQNVITIYEEWFKDNNGQKDINEESFALWTKLHFSRNRNLDVNGIIRLHNESKSEDQSSASFDALTDQLSRAKMMSGIRQLIEAYEMGEQIDIVDDLKSRINKFDSERRTQLDSTRVALDIDAMIAEDEDGSGLKFPWAELNAFTRPMRWGDAIISAARPDTGKSTWAYHVGWYAAAQMPEGQCVLFLVNEGKGEGAFKRIIQSALNITAEEMKKIGAAECKRRFYEIVGGDKKIVIHNVHQRNQNELERIIVAEKPGMVIFDMLDNVSWVGAATNNGTRTDQLLESLYKWARDMAIKHEFVSIASSQTSADAEGMLYPPQAMLKDGKTGKQGACDMIIIMGTSTNEMQESDRFFSTPKNKLLRTGGKKNSKFTLTFDGDRARLIGAGQVQRSLHGSAPEFFDENL